ncbi:MAG: cohesin domain-containing protein [Dehalococcoidia bacterium]|jgi:hypothetical protein|nr:cohesin domain-containing protein [Dehalococcoidia bacterium]
MRFWLEMGLIALSDHWKWAVGAATVLLMVVIGTLFLGVLRSDTAEAGPAPSVILEPTAIPDQVSTPIPTSPPDVVSTRSPTAVPTLSPQAADPVVLASTVNVPIYLTGAKNVGSLEFVLTYDPTVLEVSEVEAGGLAQNSLFDFGVRVPGRLWAGLIDTDGINGDGPVAVVSFKVIGPGSSTSRLTLENVSTYDARSLLDILTDATSGNFTVDGPTLTSPVLAFPR